MKFLLITLLFLLGFNSFAQKDKKEKKEKKEEKVNEKVKFIYKEVFVETDDYKIYIIDAVATDGVCKFKIKVFNKTNDYLIVKPREFALIADGKTIVSTDKNLIVPPNEETNKVIDFKAAGLRVPSFTVDIKGIYKASAGGKALTAPDFVFPAMTNQFVAGGFTCTLKNSKLETSKSSAKFDCVYTGDGIAILDSYKCSAIMPNGTANANKKKYNGSILEKGENEDFTVVVEELPGAGDMQKKGFTIKWNDTFKETKLVTLAPTKIEVLKDSEKQ